MPDWAVGKTANEVLELSKQMYGALSSARPQTPQPTYQTPQYQQPYQPQQPTSIPSNDEWLTDPNTAFQRAMGTIQQSQFAPAMDSMAMGNAANARALAEMKYQDDFRRFGPEIQMELTRVPPQMQTFDNIKYVVDLVRGRHAHELANELAEQKVKERLASGTLRPGGMDGGIAPVEATGVDFNKLPEGYQAILQRAGVKDVRDLDRFLLKYYGQDVDLQQARKDWFERPARGMSWSRASRVQGIGGKANATETHGDREGTIHRGAQPGAGRLLHARLLG